MSRPGEGPRQTARTDSWSGPRQTVRTDSGSGPRQTVRVDSGFGYGVIGADLHVFPDRGPVYLLSPYRPASAPAPAQGVRAGAGSDARPSRLLDARFQVVDFTGRTEERAELAAWRDGGGPRAALWLHGAGGQGKTRLAARFAADSVAKGWKVVSATHGAGTVHAQPGSQDLRPGDAAGLLLVVDYADRWPLSHLTWLFSNKLLDGSLPTRLLLLARSVTPWPAVRSALEDTGTRTRALALRPLDERRGELDVRRTMFTVARDCFAAHYGLADPHTIGVPDHLDRPDFGLVLALHMAALVAVDAHTRGDSPPQNMAAMSAYLLDRERRHWTRLHELRLEGLEFETPAGVMSQLVLTAALTGATPYRHGTALLGGLGMERPARLLADHAACYPPQDPGAVLEPLYPDRLAEDFLALALPGHGTSGYPAAPWAPDVIGSLVARDRDGAAPGHLARALTFLASTAAPQRWPHAARHLESLLRADPALAVAAGGAALTALAAADLDTEILEAVAARFPHRGQADLDAGIAAVTQCLTERSLSTTRDFAAHARLYQNLGYRLVRAGHREDAVAAAEKAVALLRDLTAADAATYEPALAMALAQLSERAHTAGRKEVSHHAAEDAVELFLRLVDTDPTAHEAGLALSLSHLGVCLSEARNPEAALVVTQRAMGIFQRLAAVAPDTYRPGLAVTLVNEAVLCRQQRRRTDARTAAERAVALIRRLVAAGPAASTSDFHRSVAVDESDLAAALSVLGILLWGERSRDASLAALREAVDIRSRLATANAMAHDPALAADLASLGTYLARSGRAEEALTVTARCVEIHQRLASQNPETYEKPLREAYEALRTLRDGLSGTAGETERTWTLDEHYVTLLGQDEVWQDGRDRRHRLDDMDPRYSGHVLRFLLRQADDLFQVLLDGLGASPESLGRRPGETAETWIARQPLAVALHRRSEGRPARPELCHCGYAVQPDWNHDHCYPGIIVD